MGAPGIGRTKEAEGVIPGGGDRFVVKLLSLARKVQWKDSNLPQRICGGYPSIVSTKGENDQKGARERRAGPRITYTLIPGVPEFVESLVETDGEGKGASEDASDKDAC